MAITSGTVTLNAGPGVDPASVALKNTGGDPALPAVKLTSTALAALFSNVMPVMRADFEPPGLYTVLEPIVVKLLVARFKTFSVVAIGYLRVRDFIWLHVVVNLPRESVLNSQFPSCLGLVSLTSDLLFRSPAEEVRS